VSFNKISGILDVPRKLADSSTAHRELTLKVNRISGDLPPPALFENVSKTSYILINKIRKSIICFYFKNRL